MATGMIGKVFGRLTVIAENGRKWGKRAWECRCECGTITVTRDDRLRGGETKSCGCLHAESARRVATERLIKNLEGLPDVGDRMLSAPGVSVVVDLSPRYPAGGALRLRFAYRWRTRQQLADRFGQPCRIVPQAAVRKLADGQVVGWGYGAHGSTNKMTVEFEDGLRVETTRGSIRRRAR